MSHPATSWRRRRQASSAATSLISTKPGEDGHLAAREEPELSVTGIRAFKSLRQRLPAPGLTVTT
jgi:hypothetical protein